MSEQREFYNIDPNDLVGSLVYIVNRLADRLDQLEGLRGNPTFFSQVFDFPEGAGSSGIFQISNLQAVFTDAPPITDFTNANHAHTGVSSGGQLDHGTSNTAASLLDDDHTNYHNDTRGDARYLSEIHVCLSTETTAI